MVQDTLIDVDKFKALYSPSDRIFYGHDAERALLTFPIMKHLSKLGTRFSMVTCRDYPVDQRRLDLAPECMAKWFGNNATVQDNRVQGIPIGLPPTNVQINTPGALDGTQRREFFKTLMSHKVAKDDAVYICHRNETSSIRSRLYDLFRTKDWATCQIVCHRWLCVHGGFA